jgi:hypothetical protein
MRERIISEIRRIAADAGGEPPGKSIFERESGIKESAWHGRYWARWSDALREAGFEPNEFQSKTNSNFLLSKLAEAFRHYGKIPTSAELRMYRGVDPNFPYHSTLANHFPTKAEMLSRLRTWLSEVGEYEDVLAMLPTADVEPRSKESKSASKDGSVYLLRSGSYYKIGKSDEIERRIKEIRVALPEATSLEHSILTDDPSGIEAYWHRRFADRRMNGEWFKLSTADVLAFKRRKFQ